MAKRVVIIVEGEKDRSALRYLLAHLAEEDILVDFLLAYGRLDLERVRKIVVSEWFAPKESVPPDKFVMLADADGRDPDVVLRPLEEQLRSRLGAKITAAQQPSRLGRGNRSWKRKLTLELFRFPSDAIGCYVPVGPVGESES